MRRTWYPVLERNPAADPPEPQPGYVWVRVDGEMRHIWAKHLEFRES